MVINEAGWVAFGFIIFCIIAWRYGAKPFIDVLESRANEVKEKLAEAETLRNEAVQISIFGIVPSVTYNFNF